MLVLGAVSALLGCAKPGPPGGGPPDELPPEVVSTRPASGETAVDRATTIEISFSEEMNRQTTERSLSITPPTDLRNFRWKGRTLFAEPVAALPESTTFVVRVGETATDYHGVAMGEAHAFAFSTGSVIDRTIIEGTATVGGQPVASAVVWVCRPPVVPDSLGVLSTCGYVTATDTEGRFRLANVRRSALPYSVVSFIDGDGDRRYDTASEVGSIVLDAAFVPGAADSVGGLEIPLLDPREDHEPSPASGGQSEDAR